MKLDNRNGRPGPTDTHFTFMHGSQSIAYCRIRKNGCSSFQKLICETSPHRHTSRLGGFRFVRKHHSVRSQSMLEKSHCRILVYRDPVERLESVYKNKFIQKSGSRDIMESYARVTGRLEQDIRFEDFFYDYVARLGLEPLDPHVWPQCWHVTNVLYDHAVPLPMLFEGMAGIIGRSLAEAYFLHRTNRSADHDIPISPETRADIEALYAEDYALLDRVS
jgi:hypothetical protein